MRKIVYLINPISGTKNKKKIIAAIKKKTMQQRIPFEILPTNASGDYMFLREKIRHEKITDIVICGGDGTVNQLTHALLGMEVNIGIVPLGSGNGLALAARVSKKTEKALDIIFQGQADYVDAFYVNGIFSCMLSGLGFDALVAHHFAKQSSRGLSTYIKQSIRLFFSVRPYMFEILSDRFSFATEAYLLCIANGNQFGNHVTIAPQALLNDGLLDIVVVKKMNKARMLWLLLRHLKAGKVEADPASKKDIVYFRSDRLIIRNTALAPLHIDGEPAATFSEIEVKVIPRAFRLLQPLPVG